MVASRLKGKKKDRLEDKKPVVREMHLGLSLGEGCERESLQSSWVHKVSFASLSTQPAPVALAPSKFTYCYNWAILFTERRSTGSAIPPKNRQHLTRRASTSSWTTSGALFERLPRPASHRSCRFLRSPYRKFAGPSASACQFEVDGASYENPHEPDFRPCFDEPVSEPCRSADRLRWRWRQ